MTVLEWDRPGFRVAFSTRVGGVSEGAFESLNLGMLTGDDPARVVENRRRLCDELEADPETATMALQVHGARVTEARPRGILKPGTEYEPCDGLWTGEPGVALMLVTADCLPVALARGGVDRRLAVLHVGWRGLLEGVVANGVASLRSDGGREERVAQRHSEPVAAAIGPGIGPCCYEVGEDVAGPFRERSGADVARGRALDLALATESALRELGVDEIERAELCTACNRELFFSHRRDRGVTGRQGVLAYIG